MENAMAINGPFHLTTPSKPKWHSHAISNCIGLILYCNFASDPCLLDVDFSYSWINLVEAWYSLEQYIDFEGRQTFIHYCGLHQVWREPEN